MVYNDINESDYTFDYNDMIFYFSSEFYKNKFEKMYFQFIKEETMKMKIKYKCSIVCDKMLLLLLYKRIEKRGFKVTLDGKEINENYFIDFNINDISFKR